MTTKRPLTSHALWLSLSIAACASDTPVDQIPVDAALDAAVAVADRDASKSEPTPSEPTPSEGGAPPADIDGSLSSPDAGTMVPPSSSRVPSRGEADTLDMGSWNIEWLGAPDEGPTDEALQRANAKDVIAGANLDIWGLAEIVSGDDFASLTAQLPGYAGILANDARVAQGSKYYGASEQKLGMVYRESVATLDSAKLILTANEDDFAGRPPLEAHFTITLNGHTGPLVVIVLHAKAFDDASAWNARLAAAKALKTYLDSNFASNDVIVLGDFNDELLGSITKSKPSPYATFVNDADYKLPTQELATADVGTTVGRSTTIDHHLTTQELYTRYVAGSVEAYRVDSYIPKYGTTTSDHYPVLSRYDWRERMPAP